MSGTTFGSVSAGGSHSFGITSDGRLFTWGFNGIGQLGDGRIFYSTSPILIAQCTRRIMNNLVNQINELRAQQESNRALISLLQQQLNDFMDLILDELDDHDERITALETRMTAAEDELEELGDQLEDLLEAIEGLEGINTRLDGMQADITSFNRPQLVGMIEDLEEMLEDMWKELEGLEFIDETALEPILAKIAALELALEGIDLGLSDEYLRVEIETIITEIIETVLPSTLTVLTNR